jgi:hypothetical protein
MKPDLASVLCMSSTRASRQRVRRHYAAWRDLQGIPERCDNPTCQFHRAPLLWNDRLLPLILDHESGNACDNRPENLRLLCPNCDSQNTHTRGGANAGRIKVQPTGSYEVRDRDGSQSACVNGATIGVQATVQAGIVTPVVSYPENLPTLPKD